MKTRYMILKKAVLLSLLIVGVAGCLSAKDTVNEEGGAVITQKTIQEQSSAINIYEVIRDTRPTWLRTRGPTSYGGENYPSVYIDEMRRRGSPADVLSNISSKRVKKVKYLGAGEANTKFGAGNEHGAILVYMK